jgi:hypothetical protein
MHEADDTQTSPCEVPYRVNTALGPAVVTLVCAVLGAAASDAPGEPGDNVDRLMLRSTVIGHPDVYAVFERPRGHSEKWRRITGDLTLAQLSRWRSHRLPTAGYLSHAFNSWLTTVAERG